MIERLTGEDADLIIEDRWPQRYDEDQIIASASHHRDVIAATLSAAAQPQLQTARTEAQTANAGVFAEAVATKTGSHLRASEDSEIRHRLIADQLDAFAAAIVGAKNQINGASTTFTSEWAKAPELAKANNWYQHEYNAYRSQLVNAGRATVTAALHQLTEAHQACSTTLLTALDV
ncbi:hypothetical protein QN239_31705 [Mycolicibacterium sp. Y3]